jgi:O-antigen ligase/polysaccharide polymerase Wzy-like membrane protein
MTKVNIGSDLFFILTIAYIVCLFMNAASHYIGLKCIDAPFYLNIRLITPVDWIGANSQFFVYYLFFPILLVFHRIFIDQCDLTIIIRIAAMTMLVSMMVLYYQVGFDHDVLAKWSIAAAYKKPDGLATDPNSYTMCAVLLLPFMVTTVFREKNRNWRIFFIAASLFYGVSAILTGSRTGVVAIILIALAFPFIVAASNRSIHRSRRIALICIPFLFLAIGYLLYPFITDHISTLPFIGGVYRLGLLLQNIEHKSIMDGLVKTDYRFLQFLVALILFLKAPLGGWGAGGFYREFPNEYYLYTREFTTRNDSALNHYLMISADLGIPVLVLNTLIITLPVIAVGRAFLKTDDTATRYMLSILFSVQIVFLLIINTLPPSYFPDVIWIWTCLIVISMMIAERFDVNFHIKGNRRWAVYAAMLLLIIVPNGIGIYNTTFGKAGYLSRQDLHWNPLKFERNCYFNENWKEGIVRWCKGKAILKIPVTEGRSWPGKVRLKIKALHPDIAKDPVWVKYEGKNAGDGQISISDYSWHSIDIPITESDRLTLTAFPDIPDRKFAKYFYADPPDPNGPYMGKKDDFYFFHGYKFSYDWTQPKTDVQNYIIVHFDISRNWTPKKSKNNTDSRELGIAVLIPKF